MKIRIYLLLFFLAIHAKGLPQCLTVNLIQNPGLEDFTCCPNDMTLINCADHWTQPIVGNSTSDYMNTCGIDSLLSSSMLPFWKHAYFGNGYAGILVLRYELNNPQSPQYREYIQGELSQPLLAGQCYYGRFWVKLMNFVTPANEYPTSAIDAIGILYTDTLLQQLYAIDPMAMYYPAQINNATGRIITDTTNWTMISDTFIAQGGEKYFTVGTFKQANEINQIIFGIPNFNYAYYFFDNFSLCPCGDTIPEKVPEPVVYIPNIFSPNGDNQNDVFMIRGEQIETIHLFIYNRWGNKVFETSDISQGWDGTQHSKKCDVGVYTYMAHIRFANGQEVSKKGTISLVR